MARASRDRKESLKPRSLLKAPHVHLEDCWDEPDARLNHSRTDVEELQGAWVSTSGHRVEFFFSGHQFTAHLGNGDIYMGSFTLGASARPREMDMHIHEGPAHHKGLIALCIYELDGHALRWHTVGPGQSNRPPDFPTENESRSLYLVFHREHGNGKVSVID
jgi:uncharacterized protein (TIGR03067 family)